MAPIRLASWNIGCGLFVEGQGTFQDSIEYVATQIAAIDPDIACFQEVVLDQTGFSPFLERIKSLSKLSCAVSAVLSASHVVKGAQMGLAVLSRYPITAYQVQLVPTPGFFLSGTPNRLHQKGLLRAELLIEKRKIYALSGHLPPFDLIAERPDNSEFRDLWATVDTALSGCDGPFVALMDMNLHSGLDFLPRTAALGATECIHEPTRPSGRQHDQMFLSRDFSDIATKVIPTRLDHHLCMAIASLRQKSSRSTHFVRHRPYRPVSILHLSDLHFGPGTAEDVDWKAFVPYATRETRRDRLVQFIQSLPSSPDFVVISGDITIAGREAGFVDFADTTDKLIREGFLPSPDRFVVVPGNHDVKRDIDGVMAQPSVRWADFAKYAKRFSHPILEPRAELASTILAHIREQLAADVTLVGGAFDRVNAETKERQSLAAPFLLDKEFGVLIYGFNSASTSGTKLTVSEAVSAAITKLKSANGRGAKDIRLVVDELERQLWVDPSRIDPFEFQLFGSITDFLSKEVEDFDSFTKIAVLHHHVDPVVPEEVTKFEALLNAGRFKREIGEAGFDIVLHGHKHWPGIRMEIEGNARSQLHISGGTIGGGVGPGAMPGFHWLDLASKRSSVSVRYIPISSVGNVSHEISSAFGDSETYPLRISRSTLGALNYISLLPIFDQTKASLVGYLRRMRNGSPGWSHVLDEDRVSIIATAYGLSILRLVGGADQYASDLIPQLIATLESFRNPDQGWSSSSQGSTSRPEPTTFVVDALSSWINPEFHRGGMALERLILDDPVYWRTTFSVARTTQTLARLCASDEVLQKCSEALRNGSYKNERGEHLFWTRCLVPAASRLQEFSDAAPSIVHTAHAILALLDLEKASGGRLGASRAELSDAINWILSQPEWPNVSEDINRLRDDNRYDHLVVRHFTAPWAIMAACQMGVDLHHHTLRRHVEMLAKSHHQGIWDWGESKRPIWATYDALRALIVFAQTSV